MNSTGLWVVIGAGPLGLAVIRRLIKRGHKIRIVSRSGKADVPAGIEVIAGNVSNAENAREACRGAEVIFHCANPPYARWPQEFPALQKGVIEASASAGAKLIFGDNLYMYGPVPNKLTEDLPDNARGPSGQTRARMARLVLDAHNQGKVRAAIGRASDFFGPGVLISHVGERLFGAALSGRPFQFLGNPDVPHTYTFIDDFAEGLAILGERDEALGQVWHIPSGETLTTRSFVEMVYKEAGSIPSFKIPPRLAINLMALFSPLMRALKEQLYQLDEAFVMDHTKFTRAFGDIATPHADAIRETLNWFRQRSGKAKQGT